MYACLYVPDFLLQAIVRAEPSIAGGPVAIVDGTPPLAKVVALNKKAVQSGACRGMSKIEAAQIPKLVIRQRSPAQEAITNAALLDLASGFSPRIEVSAPDTIVLDLAGLRQLLGSPEIIARHLVRHASGLGLKIQAAVASNIDAAIHTARGRRGLTVIPAGKEAESLDSLPVEVLAPAPEILETLAHWGVRTFRALAALPTAQLSERLGQQGLRLQMLARGKTSRLLIPAEPPVRFEELMELEYPVVLLDPLAFILGRMLDQLTKRLEAHSLATSELRLKLDLENVAPDPDTITRDAELRVQNPGSPVPNSDARTLRLPMATRNPKLLLKLLLLHLKTDPPHAPVLKIVLAAEPATPRVAQGGLFFPPSPDPEKLAVTLARITGIVGKGKVGSAEIEDSHRPDAFRMRLFDASASKKASRKNKSRSRSVPGSQLATELRLSNCEPAKPENTKQLPDCSARSLDSTKPLRPDRLRIDKPSAEKSCRDYTNDKRRKLMVLRLLRPPRPATVELSAGRPQHIFASGLNGDVIAASGPWHTSGHWWRDDAWAHDEWDVMLTGRLTCHIFRDLRSGKWFVRGIYD